MTASSGTHDIGPNNGSIKVHTKREGMGAKIGHDLVLEVKRWSGTVEVNPDNPSASSVQVSIDPSSLEVVQASGGVKPLSDKDRVDIRKNIDEKTLKTGKFTEIAFKSTGVDGQPPQLTVRGNLTIVGTTRPATLSVNVADGSHVVAKTTIVQSEFGIKPFSAMLGALKVADAVGLEVDLTL